MRVPSPDAYGRITDSARFAVLHHGVRDLLEELDNTFRVDPVSGLPLDPELLGRTTAAEATLRLTPIGCNGAPLTVAFTTFPGVLIRYGRWCVEGYPSCGCDACNEQPAELLSEMVAQGRAIQSPTGRRQLGAMFAKASHAIADRTPYKAVAVAPSPEDEFEF